MTSPARRHMHQVLAAQAAGLAHADGPAPMPTTGAVGQEYALLRAALGEDLRRLSLIQSLERKIAAKREMLPRYRDWVAGALAAERAAGRAVQDDIVVTMLVWAIDVAEWPLALDLARHVMGHRLVLPERYKRTAATLIAEEVAEAGLAVPVGVDLTTLQVVEDMTAEADMPDEVRAKLRKAIGLAFKARADAFEPDAESAPAGGRRALLAAAQDHLVRALALDARCGVKKLIEGIARELRADPTES